MFNVRAPQFLTRRRQPTDSATNPSIGHQDDGSRRTAHDPGWEKLKGMVQLLADEVWLCGMYELSERVENAPRSPWRLLYREMIKLRGIPLERRGVTRDRNGATKQEMFPARPQFYDRYEWAPQFVAAMEAVCAGRC